MFISKQKIAELEYNIKYEREERWKMEERIWRLHDKILLLTNHLGLEIVTKPEETVVREKNK